MNEKIAAEYGIIDEEDAKRPGLDRCPQCQTPLRKSSRFCPGCGAPITASAVETMDQMEDDAITTVANADESKIERAMEFREMLKDDPELRQVLLEE
jgi:predicted amidophosphoribosyltransferase